MQDLTDTRLVATTHRLSSLILLPPPSSRSWFPKNKTPIGLIFLTHGVNEHIGRYHNLAHMLVEIGYGVLGHDHIGHGLSDGFKGDIEDFGHCIHDLKQFITSQRNNYAHLPFFLIGKSVKG